MPPPSFAGGVADRVPVHLQIPSVGIDTNIESVGLLRNGAMDVPKAVADAGWLATGVTPGTAGNAVIDGHLDSAAGRPAAFWSLGDLRAGDRIIVTTADGTALQFIALRIARYDRLAMPLPAIFGPSIGAHLNLITCAGSYVARDHTYQQRLVVYAELATS
jgi:hypothetical protein